jgi:hypothetical protein
MTMATSCIEAVEKGMRSSIDETDGSDDEDSNGDR